VITGDSPEVLVGTFLAHFEAAVTATAKGEPDASAEMAGVLSVTSPPTRGALRGLLGALIRHGRLRALSKTHAPLNGKMTYWPRGDIIPWIQVTP
jgi:hypothetical protein